MRGSTVFCHHCAICRVGAGDIVGVGIHKVRLIATLLCVGIISEVDWRRLVVCQYCKIYWGMSLIAENSLQVDSMNATAEGASLQSQQTFTLVQQHPAESRIKSVTLRCPAQHH